MPCHTYLSRPDHSSGLRVLQLQRFLNHSILFHLEQCTNKSIWCVTPYTITARLWVEWVLSGAGSNVSVTVLERNTELLTSISFGTVSWQLLCFHMSTHCEWQSSRIQDNNSRHKQRVTSRKQEREHNYIMHWPLLSCFFKSLWLQINTDLLHWTNRTYLFSWIIVLLLLYHSYYFFFLDFQLN